MSRSPSESIATPFWPAAIRSLALEPMMTSVSVRSPSAVASSISGMLNSEVKPGPKKASDMSRVRTSFDPEDPATETESVFVLVAAPHATGTCPKRS